VSCGNRHCGGTFRGFRQDPDPNAFAVFTLESQGTSMLYLFQASIGGASYSCIAVNPGLQALWPAAIANRGGFGIYWDEFGHCTQLALANSSDAGY
jgi:hypothetical protein